MGKAKVKIVAGQGYLQDPSSGAVVPIPEGEIQSALESGYLPATEQAYRGERLEEEYGGLGGALKTGAAAAARTASLGLSDVALTGIMGVDPQTLRLLKEANPVANITGTLGGLAVPGGPLTALGRGAARIGEGAGALTARAFGQSATAAAPRLARNLAREGLVGAGMGLGQGVSDVALEEVAPADAAAHILGSAGKGTLAGLGVGGLSWLGGVAAARVRDKYTLGMSEIKALRGERTALQAEREAAVAGGASAEGLARLDAQLAAVSESLSQKQIGAIGKVLSRTAAYAVGHAVGGGLTGGLIGIIAGPKAINLAMKALEPIGAKAAELGKKAWSSAEPYIRPAYEAAASTARAGYEKVAPYLEAALETPLGRAVATGAAAKVSQKISGFAEAAAQRAPSFARGVIGEVGEAAARIPDLILTGAMVGGVQGAAAGAAAHVLKQPLGRAVEALTRKVAPPARMAVIDALTNDDWKALGDEVGALDRAELATGLQLQLPEHAPQEVKSAVVQRIEAAVDYLQRLKPPEGEALAAIPVQVQKAALEATRTAYARAARAIASPSSLLEDFAAGKLTADQVRAWEAVYPEALAQLRADVRAKVERAKSSGGSYDRERAEQISILMGDPEIGPRSARPAMMNRIQKMHRAARGAAKTQEPSGMRSASTQRATGPGRPGRFSMASFYQTPMQRHRGAL